MVTRKILFRGKRKDNGEWVYGSLIKTGNYCCILPDDDGSNYEYPYLDSDLGTIDGCAIPVIPETVGQYVGLIDRNGTKLFEGDIVKGKDGAKDRYPDFYGYIGHGNGSFVIIGEAANHYRWLDYEVEIVGNIHDNPDLLWGDD